MTYSHRGDGNFIVDIINTADGSPGDNVANEIGRVSSQTSVYGLDGTYAFDVSANGPWTLSVTRQ